MAKQILQDLMKTLAIRRLIVVQKNYVSIYVGKDIDYYSLQNKEMAKRSTIYVYTFIIVIVIYLAIMAYIYYKEFGISYHSDLGNYLSGVFALISALGTIFISYLIYKLTTIENRSEKDFKFIIGLYYKIEETFELLKRNDNNLINNENHNSFYERQIKVDCILLINYIRRYPYKKYSTKELEKVLMSIYVNPNYESDYICLSEEFVNFCYELNPDWDTTVFKLEQ